MTSITTLVASYLEGRFTSGLKPGSDTTILASAISSILRGSAKESSDNHIWSSKCSHDLQTRFSCPVPTLRVTNLTIVVQIVRVPKTKVTVTPVEGLMTPWINKIRGRA